LTDGKAGTVGHVWLDFTACASRSEVTKASGCLDDKAGAIGVIKWDTWPGPAIISLWRQPGTPNPPQYNVCTIS
jgi:hypothetical protein